MDGWTDVDGLDEEARVLTDLLARGWREPGRWDTTGPCQPMRARTECGDKGRQEYKTTEWNAHAPLTLMLMLMPTRRLERYAMLVGRMRSEADDEESLPADVTRSCMLYGVTLQAQALSSTLALAVSSTFMPLNLLAHTQHIPVHVRPSARATHTTSTTFPSRK